VIANIELVSKLFLTKTTYAILLALAFGGLLWEFPFLPRQLSAGAHSASPSRPAQSSPW
jgi:cation-transporting ATPase E